MSGNLMDRKPLPAPDMGMVRHIHSLMGMPVPDVAAAATPLRAVPVAKPESLEAKVDRIWREKGYPKGMLPLQPNCVSPADVEAREQIRREVYSEYQSPTNTEQVSPPPQAYAVLSEQQARSQLRITIAALNDAEKAVTDAAEVTDRARNRLRELNTELAQYASLNNDVLECSVRNMRTGQDDNSIPYALERSLVERSRLKDRIDQYQQALQRLLQEQRQYEVKAVQAKQTATNAAIAVIRIMAGQYVDEIEELEGRAQQFRTLLLSLGRVWTHGMVGPKPIELSPRIVAVIHKPVQQITDADPAAIQHWRDILDHLLVNPDTEI